MDKAQIGITLITGFLGSGKTSLLNQILKKEQRFKFAIIENEFSEFGIDAELIKGIELPNIIELSNGCICCTRNTELQETLIQLLESGLFFNHILIETTGIAEPDSIIQSIVSNIELKGLFYVDSVICLVDSINYYINIENGEAIKQISLSDLVLVNKIELSDIKDVEMIEKEISLINPICKIIRTSYGNYQNLDLIGRKSFNYDDFDNAFKRIHKIVTPIFESESKLQSVAIEIDGDFMEDKFRFWMEYFLMVNQKNIFRAKGILSFKGNSRKIIFQAVKASFILEESDFWPSCKDRAIRMIFIGKELKTLNIEENLKLLMHN